LFSIHDINTVTVIISFIICVIGLLFILSIAIINIHRYRRLLFILPIIISILLLITICSCSCCCCCIIDINIICRYNTWSTYTMYHNTILNIIFIHRITVCIITLTLIIIIISSPPFTTISYKYIIITINFLHDTSTIY